MHPCSVLISAAVPASHGRVLLLSYRWRVKPKALHVTCYMLLGFLRQQLLCSSSCSYSAHCVTKTQPPVTDFPASAFQVLRLQVHTTTLAQNSAFKTIWLPMGFTSFIPNNSTERNQRLLAPAVSSPESQRRSVIVDPVSSKGRLWLLQQPRDTSSTVLVSHDSFALLFQKQCRAINTSFPPSAPTPPNKTKQTKNKHH